MLLQNSQLCNEYKSLLSIMLNLHGINKSNIILKISSRSISFKRTTTLFPVRSTAERAVPVFTVRPKYKSYRISDGSLRCSWKERGDHYWRSGIESVDTGADGSTSNEVWLFAYLALDTEH